MPRLIQCLQKVTAKVDSDKINPKTGKPKEIPIFDHEIKRGMISVANAKVRDSNMSVAEAEAETIRELRDKAQADAASVEEALAPEATPRAMLATPRRPVDRDKKTDAAFAAMHAHPEKALLLAQRIQRDYQRVRAETKAMLAALPPGTGKEEYKDLRKIQAFAELNALVGALPPEIRAGIFGSTETLAKLRSTDASLGAFMERRIESIDTALENYFQKLYAKKIETTLFAKRARKQPSGVVKSTVGADAQDVITRVTGYTKMTGEQVANRYQAIENELMAGVDPEQESKLLMEQHELAMFGAIKDMSAGQLEAALTDLQNTIKQGQASWGPKEEARLKERKLKAASFVGSLPPATESGAAEKKGQTFRNWIRNYARNHTSFVQILERLFPGAAHNAEWVSTALKADQSDQAYVRDMNTRFFNAIAAAAGTKSQWRVSGILEDMRKKRFIPVPDGGKATKNEAIQFLFAWAQPKVQERMRLQGWTDAHIRTLESGVADPVSQAAMQFMKAGYEQIYQKVNPVYVSQYGMNLPRVEGQYAPMRYRAAGAITHMSPTGMSPASGITPGSLKARVSHNAQLLQVDAMDVFREHLLQLSHWAHFAPFIRETRGVLGDAGVKLALEQQIGRDGVGDLQKQLDAITRNGVARSMDVSATTGMMDYITRGAAITALAFNAATSVIQGDSALRWMAAIPMQRWGGALLLHQWLPKISQGWHSDSVQNRVKEGMNPAMQSAMASSHLTPSRLLLGVHAGFWHLRLTDGALTSVSSAIVYTDAINQGMSHEQALQLMDEAVGRFSQPTLSVAKSQGLLTGNAFSRTMLMFMADPVLKTAMIAEGTMLLGRGLANRDLAMIEKGVRQIVAVEIWSLFSQTLMCIWQSLTSDDDDEEIWTIQKFLRAMAVAPFQGWFFAGNIFEGITRKFIFEEKWFPPQTPIGRMVQNMQRGWDWWDDLMLLDPTDPDFRKAFEGAMDSIGGLAGPAAVIPAAAKQGSKAWGAAENFEEKYLE